MTDGPFFRAYPAQIEQTGPRQLSGKLVPYDTPAFVLDTLPDGTMETYDEGFRRGAFAPQANNPGKGVVNKIGLVHTHGQSGLGYLGPFIGLREEADGLYGDVRILPTLAENVSALLEEGVDELSVEFRLPRDNHTIEVDGVKWRVRAHLDQVALEPKGAYSTAQVLAFRAELDEVQQEQAEHDAREAEERAEAERAATSEREKAELQEQENEARLAREAIEAAEAAERRRQWDELTNRLPETLEKQEQLVREFGVKMPNGSRTYVPPTEHRR